MEKIPGAQRPYPPAADPVRALVRWLGQWPGVDTAGPIAYGTLPPGQAGMALFPLEDTQGPVRYITGGYAARVPVRLTARVLPAGPEDRLAADAALRDLARWAVSGGSLPDLGEGARCTGIWCGGMPVTARRWPDGSEDHEMTMTMMYEVL